MLWAAALACTGCVTWRAPEESAAKPTALDEQLSRLRDEGGAPAPKRRAPVRRGEYVVVSGDTLWGIARKHHVSVRELAAANGLDTSDVLVVGRRLNIPGAARATSPRPTRTTTPAARTSQALPRAEGRWAWPVRGRVARRFGQSVGGIPASDLVIAAASGSPVAAAKSGTVSFVSNSFEGWGKLVVLRHAGGWHTWYAHLGSHAVQPGQAVRQGQTLGTVGRTGRATQPQLSLRVLRNGVAVDPQRYLP